MSLLLAAVLVAVHVDVRPNKSNNSYKHLLLLLKHFERKLDTLWRSKKKKKKLRLPRTNTKNRAQTLLLTAKRYPALHSPKNIASVLVRTKRHYIPGTYTCPVCCTAAPLLV